MRRTQETAAAWSMDARSSEQIIELLAEAEPGVSFAAQDVLVQRGASVIDALLGGLRHPNRKTRATCALLLDHVADNRCVAPLRKAMFTDSDEAVRRCAMHSLICDGCKECPLDVDVVGALLEAAQTDRALSVRRRAVFYLSMQPPDSRVVSGLQELLTRDIDPVLRCRAERTLLVHSVGITA